MVIFKLSDILGDPGTYQSEQPVQLSFGLLERALDLKTKYLLEVPASSLWTRHINSLLSASSSVKWSTQSLLTSKDCC